MIFLFFIISGIKWRGSARLGFRRLAAAAAAVTPCWETVAAMETVCLFIYLFSVCVFCLGVNGGGWWRTELRPRMCERAPPSVNGSVRGVSFGSFFPRQEFDGWTQQTDTPSNSSEIHPTFLLQADFLLPFFQPCQEVWETR